MNPTDIILTSGESKFRVSDSFMDTVNEFLADTYGKVPSSFCYEIKLTDIDWEE